MCILIQYFSYGFGKSASRELRELWVVSYKISELEKFTATDNRKNNTQLLSQITHGNEAVVNNKFPGTLIFTNSFPGLYF